MAKPAFKLIEKLFHEAAAQPAATRSAFLDEACAGDADLRAAVEDLLRHASLDDQTLAGPIASAAAHLRGESPTVKLDPALTRGGSPSWPEIPGYRVLEELGRGGMGVVYKARQISLNRIVALKMLLPAHPDGEEVLARFRTEVDALARLQHPNIITIYDIGEDAGRPYFTMEYIDGPNLAGLLDGRPQEPVGTARLVETVARTMHAVHQQGIVHRDLRRHADECRSLAGFYAGPAAVRLHSQDNRLRPGQGSGRGQQAHRDRHDDGDASLHGAGAGWRAGRRWAGLRYLCPRFDPVRAPDRPDTI